MRSFFLYSTPTFDPESGSPVLNTKFEKFYQNDEDADCFNAHFLTYVEICVSFCSFFLRIHVFSFGGVIVGHILTHRTCSQKSR